MRVGLIGVPGAGKSALAHTLQKGLAQLPTMQDTQGAYHTTVIDGYTEMVRVDTDLAIGFEGGYFVNLAIAIERANRERKLNNLGYITCGTLFDTAAYAAIDGTSQMRFDDAIEKIDAMARLEAIMKMLGVLYMDTIKYDYIFYLNPLDAPDDEQIKSLDKNVQIAFNSFGLANIHPLISEHADPVEVAAERCAQALKIITGAE